MTEDRTPEDRMASFRANNQRAIAALEAVAAYAQTRPWQTSSLPAGADPERDHERLSRVLCGLRHLSDQFNGLRFHQIRSTADELYTWARTALPDSSAGAEAAAAAAIDIYELVTPAQMRRPGSIWPLDILAEFDSCDEQPRHLPGGSRRPAHLRARRQPPAVRRPPGPRLQLGMAAGLRAHAQQCLSAYGPIDTGLIPDRRPAVVLSPSRAAPPFGPVVTHQGVVTAFGDAEWLLIRTAARIEHIDQHEYLTSDRDLDDRRTLADALARGMQPSRRGCSQPAHIPDRGQGHGDRARPGRSCPSSDASTGGPASSRTAILTSTATPPHS